MFSCLLCTIFTSVKHIQIPATWLLKLRTLQPQYKLLIYIAKLFRVFLNKLLILMNFFCYLPQRKIDPNWLKNSHCEEPLLFQRLTFLLWTYPQTTPQNMWKSICIILEYSIYKNHISEKPFVYRVAIQSKIVNNKLCKKCL